MSGGTPVRIGEKELSEAIALLDHPRSPKRRSGAKRLRRLGDSRACRPLHLALEDEVRDPRTWETQYQLIMALAMSGCREAAPFLEELAARSLEATMVYTALGDALVRLGREHEQDPTPARRLMAPGNAMLTDGAFRAVAMLRLTLTEEAVRDIVDFASGLPMDHFLRFWVAASAAGWHGEHVEEFLRLCLGSSREDLRRAASASLKQEYVAWRPL